VGPGLKTWDVVGLKTPTDGGTSHRFEGVIFEKFHLIRAL